jgi:hypothetical protein
MNRPTTRLEFFLLGILTGIIGMYAASFLRRDILSATGMPGEIPVAVRIVASTPEPSPTTEVTTIKLCSASGMRARSRCPITREVRVAEAWATLAVCPLHARVCPSDGKLYPLQDVAGEDIFYCPDHGARLEDVP